ncbi:hypothetical protein CYMTET_44783 [Cymbomonas tetramitiformis]|uniref:Uncharacterized protein n=1 Tax=Cymbomonas tetramitiformis TaxID=36881 RepID=A0AAE0EZ00_9CHLO|nr:hypothetical protein CYMTET_44783 [Cymbomonas tetramitiformis]
MPIGRGFVISESADDMLSAPSPTLFSRAEGLREPEKNTLNTEKVTGNSQDTLLSASTTTAENPAETKPEQRDLLPSVVEKAREELRDGARTALKAAGVLNDGEGQRTPRNFAKLLEEDRPARQKLSSDEIRAAVSVRRKNNEQPLEFERISLTERCTNSPVRTSTSASSPRSYDALQQFSVADLGNLEWESILMRSVAELVGCEERERAVSRETQLKTEHKASVAKLMQEHQTQTESAMDVQGKGLQKALELERQKVVDRDVVIEQLQRQKRELQESVSHTIAQERAAMAAELKKGRLASQQRVAETTARLIQQGKEACGAAIKATREEERARFQKQVREIRVQALRQNASASSSPTPAQAEELSKEELEDLVAERIEELDAEVKVQSEQAGHPFAGVRAARAKEREAMKLAVSSAEAWKKVYQQAREEEQRLAKARNKHLRAKQASGSGAQMRTAPAQHPPEGTQLPLSASHGEARPRRPDRPHSSPSQSSEASHTPRSSADYANPLVPSRPATPSSVPDTRLSSPRHFSRNQPFTDTTEIVRESFEIPFTTNGPSVPVVVEKVSPRGGLWLSPRRDHPEAVTHEEEDDFDDTASVQSSFTFKDDVNSTPLPNMMNQWLETRKTAQRRAASRGHESNTSNYSEPTLKSERAITEKFIQLERSTAEEATMQATRNPALAPHARGPKTHSRTPRAVPEHMRSDESEIAQAGPALFPSLDPSSPMNSPRPITRDDSWSQMGPGRLKSSSPGSMGGLSSQSVPTAFSSPGLIVNQLAGWFETITSSTNKDGEALGPEESRESLK